MTGYLISRSYSVRVKGQDRLAVFCTRHGVHVVVAVKSTYHKVDIRYESEPGRQFLPSELATILGLCQHDAHRKGESKGAAVAGYGLRAGP